MRVVVDTNVIISGLLSPEGNPAIVLYLVLGNKTFVPCISKEVFSEYKKVLSYGKFKNSLSESRRQKLLKQFKQASSFIVILENHQTLVDPDDTKFLACAAEAGADFLITGNLKHFPRQYRGVKVVSPNEFLAIIAKSTKL